MTAADRPHDRDAWWIAGIVLLAFAIRYATADYGLWFDELASLAFAEQPIARLWSGWLVRESNPPLFYTLLAGWRTVVPESDRALRLLPIVIGTAGIVIGALLARRVAGRAAGPIAAALFAVSAAHVDYSQELRGYGLAHAAALLALWGIAQFLDRPTRGALALWMLGAIVTLYAHTTMLWFVVLAGGTTGWLLRSDRAALARFAGATVLALLAWSWWAWISILQMRAPDRGFAWIARPTLGEAWEMTGVAYLPGYVASGGAASALFLAALALLLLWQAWRDRRPAMLVLTACAVGGPVLLFVASQAVPIFLPRTILWASGPMVVLVAIALCRIPSPALRVAAVAALLAVQATALLRWLPIRQEEAWSEALASIAHLDPRAIVVVQGEAMAVAAERYRPAVAPSVRIMVLPADRGDGDRWARGMAAAAHRPSAIPARSTAGQRRVFSLARGDHDPADIFRDVAIGRELPAATAGLQPHVFVWRMR